MISKRDGCTWTREKKNKRVRKINRLIIIWKYKNIERVKFKIRFFKLRIKKEC